MIGPAPKTPWGEYQEKAGSIQYVDEGFKKVCPEGQTLWRVKQSAPDSVKRAFEKHFTDDIKFRKKYFFPDMKDPYYTWEGKIVERDSLKDRKLPLAE